MEIKKYYNLGKKVLYPINRSITGSGTEQTLKIIKNYFKNLKIKKIKSGTKAFDWKVPPEWNVRNAYIIDKYGKKIIDFKKNNLHLIGYSESFKKKISKEKLIKHLYSLPKQPNAIPYMTSYYKRYWGFCLSHKEKLNIIKKYKKKDKFKVFIDSTFSESGFLNYGELVIKGKSKQEILISTYICHPSMANNELSGPIVSMALIDYFQKKKIEKTLRFLFIPETIGSIVYLSKNLNKLKKNVIGGYNLTCIGDEMQHSCMLTKYKNTLSDFALIEAYKKLRIKYKEYSFLKRGSDERQYNSPGIDLPIASIFRTKYHEYKQYHTSLDNFNLVTLKGLMGGFKVASNAISILLKNVVPKSNIFCEPFLSKRKLYKTISDGKVDNNSQTLLDVLQFCDGKNDINTISNKTNLKKKSVNKILNFLKKNKIIEL